MPDVPRIPTEDGKIHVLLTYVEDDPETYVHLFTSRQAVKDFVVDGIRRDYEELARQRPSEAWEVMMKQDMEEAVRCLDEHGQWNDRDGITYVYDEKEWTA